MAGLGSEWRGTFRQGKARSGMAGMVGQDRSSCVGFRCGWQGRARNVEVGSALVRLASYVKLG